MIRHVRPVFAVLAIGLLTLWGQKSDADNDTPVNSSPAQVAIQKAAANHQFSYVVVFKEKDDATKKMKAIAVDTGASLKGQVAVVEVNKNESAESSFIAEYDLSRMPMPLMFVVAPNGAVTGAFPLKVTAEELRGTLVSPATANCLKAAQEGKLCLLSVEPEKKNAIVLTNAAAFASFAADSRFKDATAIVNVSSADPHETAFLETIEAFSQIDQPVTLFLAPGGQVIGKYVGAVSKDQLVSDLEKAQNSCCPGGKCGPNGCCPGGQCKPKAETK